MRDVKRIPKILKRLQTIWEKNPDMRLSQLMANVFPCTPDTQRDMYYFPDEIFISTLETFYSEDRTYRIGGKAEFKKIIDKARKQKMNWFEWSIVVLVSIAEIEAVEKHKG